jgi:hypothetical protein
MPMSALAESIYKILRQRVPSDDPTIFYAYLVEELGTLPPPNQSLQPRDEMVPFDHFFFSLSWTGTVSMSRRDLIMLLVAATYFRKCGDAMCAL